MNAQNYIKQQARKAVDQAGYQGIPLFNVPYKTLCQAAGLTKEQASYKGEEQSSFPVFGPPSPLKRVVRRVEKKDLARALVAAKRKLTRDLSFVFMPLR